MSGAHLRTPDAPPGFIMPTEMVSAEQRWRHKASPMWPLETEVQTSPAPQANAIIRKEIPTGPETGNNSSPVLTNGLPGSPRCVRTQSSMLKV